MLPALRGAVLPEKTGSRSCFPLGSFLYEAQMSDDAMMALTELTVKTAKDFIMVKSSDTAEDGGQAAENDLETKSSYPIFPSPVPGSCNKISPSFSIKKTTSARGFSEVSGL